MIMTRVPDDDDCCCKNRCEDECAPVPKGTGPPDGGWGWLVVLASMICMMIVDGICYTIPMFGEDLQDYFKCTTAQMTLVGSLLAGCYLIVGPFVSALVGRYGAQKVAILGSIISAAAFLLATQSSSIVMLIVTLGVIGGIGFGMIYLPAIVIIGFWFEKKRAFATGIVVCGSGIGIMVFAPFGNYLREEYGWIGGIVILAGIILNGCVCGALFRPLEIKKAKPVPQMVEIQRGSIMKALIEEKKRQRTISNGSLDNCIITKDNRLIKIDPSFFEAKRNNSFIARFKESLGFSTKSLDKSKQSLVVPSIKIDQVSNGTGSQNVSPIYKPSAKCNSQSSVNNSNDSGCNVSPDCVLTAKSCDVIPGANPWKKLSLDSGLNVCAQSCKSVNCPVLPASGMGASVISIQVVETPSPKRTRHRAYRSSSSRSIAYSGSGSLQPSSIVSGSVMSIPQYSCRTLENYEKEPSTLKKILYLLKEMFDFHLLKSKMFALLVFTSMLSLQAFFIPFWFIRKKAEMENIGPGAASILVSILGITNTIGRVISGWVADRPWADSLHLNNFALVAAGITMFITPSCQDYAALAIDCAVLGLCLALFVSLRSILLVDLLGLDMLTKSFGILILFQGIATMTGPPIAGFLIDLTKNVNTCFYVAGALFTTAGLLGIPLRRIRNWELGKEPPPLPEEMPITKTMKVEVETTM